MEEEIRISGIVKESIVDGPGIRYVLFTQGCPHNCPGCHNPGTHDSCGGTLVKLDSILDEIHNDPLVQGVTFSGGEPFLQAKPLAKFAKVLKAENKDIMVYTGFEYEYLNSHSNETNGFKELLEASDILVDGRFDESKKDERLLFKGSSNQRIIDTKKSLKEGSVILKNLEEY